MTEIYNSLDERLKTVSMLRGLQESGLKIGQLEAKEWDNIVELVRKRDMEKYEQIKKELEK